MIQSLKTWILPEWYLTLAVLLSMVLHMGAVILPIFTPPPPISDFTHDKGIKVILVNAKTDTAPLKSHLLAQNALDGGGDDDQALYAQSLHPSLSPQAATEQNNQAQKEVDKIEAQQQQLLQQLQALERSVQVQQKTTTVNGASSTTSALTSDSIAALSKEIQEFNQRPRKHFFAPSTSEYRYATYVHAWEKHIETVGTANYPPEAKGHIYGQLRFTVYIRSDGSVIDVEIDEPSPYNVLNKAALKIIQLAQPFAPFPPSIAKDTDILAITRTLNFTNNAISTSQ